LAERGIKVPAHPGLDTMGCMEAARAGRLKVGWALGGNLYGSNPDAAFAAAALARLEQLVYLSTSLNTGHAHGRAKETLILPVLARDEEPYRTTQESMFNFVRMSDGGARRFAGPRGEVEIVGDVAARVLGERSGPLVWRELVDTAKTRELIAAVVPGLEPLGAMAKGKERAREFEVAGRVLQAPRFPTASGKAAMHAHPAPALAAGGPETLTLMTVRSEGQFNTVVFEEHDLYRGQDRRDVVLLHPEDLVRLGLVPGQAVEVKSATGSLRVQARPFAIARGCALMYYPEANALLPRDLDPRSKTPAFKAARVEVRALGGRTAPVQPVGRGAAQRGDGGIAGVLRRTLARRRRQAFKAC
jgi:anaerobic selenocysteine-containing dehydrogenase